MLAAPKPVVRRKAAMGYFSGGTALQQGYVDLGQFLVSDLGGVEFHNVGDMPAEFSHTGGGCGALYLWTREK